MVCVSGDRTLVHFFEALRGDLRFWQVQQVLDQKIPDSEKAKAIRTWLKSAEKVVAAVEEIDLLTIGVSTWPEEVKRHFTSLRIVHTRGNPLKEY